MKAIARRLAVGLLTAGLVLASVGASRASTVADSGWWDRNQGVTIGSPTPPPEGALRVANDPAGASAVAAVRYTLNPDESEPVLTLRVTGDPVPAGAGFEACATDGTWTGSDGGSFDEAPVARCDVATTIGTVSEDGTTVTFDLAAMVRGATVDAVISPAPTAGDPIGDTFVTDFAAPVAPDLRTTTPTEPADSFTPPPATAPTTAPPTTRPPPIRVPTPTTAFVPSDITVPPPTTIALGAVDPTSTTAFPSVPAVDDLAGSPLDDVAGTSGRNRLGAGIVALALIGLGGWWWRKEQALDTSGPELGGLGKFVRERSEPAPEVS